jgi:hypothetical protein
VFSFTENRYSSIINSIIYWNGLGPDSYWKFPPGTQFSITYSDIQGGLSGGYPYDSSGIPKPKPTFNIDVDPCFMKLGYLDSNGSCESPDLWVEGDYRLSPDSLCIDAGGTAFLTDNKDLAGKPRTSGARLDMGAYEYQNNPPVAEAGPDKNAYAWIDGNAAVPLDGSASHDPDGDKLSYLWNWSVDANSFGTTGVSPAIQLPIGTFKITLTVNDSFVDSQPDDVNITVVPPVKGFLWFWPQLINRQFYPKDVMAILKLPAGISKDQIDSDCKLSLYPCGIEAQTQKIMYWVDAGVSQTAVIASFDCSAMLDAIDSNGLVNLSAVGKFTTGQYFFAKNPIRIIKPFQFPKPPSCDK